MSRPLVVHFTSHSCLVSNPAALEPDNDRIEPYPRWIACWHRGARPLKPERNRYTTKVIEVTCRGCRADLEESHWDGKVVTRDLEESHWDGKVVTRELTAHRVCCSGRGAPLLADRDAMAQLERYNMADRLKSIAMPVVTIFPIDDDDRVMSMTLRSWIEKRVAELEPHEIELLQPAINECTMAADLAEEIAPMLVRARAHTLAAMESIRSGRLALAAGGAA